MSASEKRQPSLRKRHTNSRPLRTSDTENVVNVLEAIDREIAFYRRRAGQVFFLGLLVEILILAGREQQNIIVPPDPDWLRPFAFSLFFIGVAVVGVTLGSEYRRRIRRLKDSRLDLLAHMKYDGVYSEEPDQRLSEIQVLYVVLTLLSSFGITLHWLPRFFLEPPMTKPFFGLAVSFLAIALVGIGYWVVQLLRWLISSWRNRHKVEPPFDTQSEVREAQEQTNSGS